MALTASLSTVTQYIVDMLDTAKVSLTVDEVYYGDQEKVPNGRHIAVEPVQREREYAGAASSLQMLNTFTVQIFTYVSGMGVESIRKECDVLAEAVETLLHADVKLGGLIIMGWVSSNESGYVIRSGALMRCSRLTWMGTSKTLL